MSKTKKNVPETATTNTEAESREPNGGRIRSLLRSKITGSEDIPVRSVLRDKLAAPARRLRSKMLPHVPRTRPVRLEQFQSPSGLTFVHKMTFFVTVLVCAGVQAIAILEPTRLKWLYCALFVPVLYPLRYYVYKSRKWQYFLLDFCYFTNYALLMAIATGSRPLWRCVYIWANGPVAVAIVGWRNSLVFHSLDKVTTFAIHVLPMLVTICEVWAPGGILNEENPKDGRWWTMLISISGYVVWQSLYLLQTELLDRELLDSDPHLLTSLRWIAANPTGGMYRIAHRAANSLGISLDDAERAAAARGSAGVDPCSAKIKIVFVIFQFFYTIACTLLPVYVLRRSAAINVAFAICMIAAAVWNGACYYFAVFATAYERRRKEGSLTMYALARAPGEAEENNCDDDDDDGKEN